VSGWLDSSLTRKGRQQAYKLGSIISKLDNKPKQIFHSDLSRARDTAYAVKEKLDIGMESHSGLREHNFGIYEGEHSWADVFDILQQGQTPDSGESYDMFFERAFSVFQEILNTSVQHPILITAHGGIAQQLKRILKQPYNYGGDNTIIENCHLHYFEPWPENEKAPWRVYVFDDVNGEVVRSPAEWCPSIVS